MLINDEETVSGPKGGHQESGHGGGRNTLMKQLSVCERVCYYSMCTCEDLG